MPFSSEHVERLVGELTYYFAGPSKEGIELKTVGFFDPINNNIFASTDSGKEKFPITIMHEIGHKLGLGESLTELFAEEIAGTQEPRTDAGFNWVYNCDFERQLLKKVGSQKFWRAAFTSNKEFGKLWDENIKVISYDELMTMRAINASFIGCADSFLGLPNIKERKRFAVYYNIVSEKEPDDTMEWIDWQNKQEYGYEKPFTVFYNAFQVMMKNPEDKELTGKFHEFIDRTVKNFGPAALKWGDDLGDHNQVIRPVNDEKLHNAFTQSAKIKADTKIKEWDENLPYKSAEVIGYFLAFMGAGMLRRRENQHLQQQSDDKNQ